MRISHITLLTVSLSVPLHDSAHSQITQAWVARYNGVPGGYDSANSIAVDSSGNVYVTGSSTPDYATIKYNSEGVEQWVRRYNGPGPDADAAYSIALDGSGNVYVTGASSGIGTNWDYTTIKYNSDGVQQWVQIYNGPGNYEDVAVSLAVDGLGNVYVTGYSTGMSFDRDYATIKYNSDGVQQWVQRYNGPGNSEDWASSITVDGSGNVYVTGASGGTGTDSDFATIKYNSAGALQWVQRYNGPGNNYDHASSITVDSSGNVYVTGHSRGIGTAQDFATIKYNSDGIEQWVQRYNGPGNGNDAASSITIDNSGNIYVTGGSRGIGTGDQDFATIKYNSDGVQQWVQRYNGPGNSEDWASSITVDRSGSVYLTGTSSGSGTSWDYATIKYDSDGFEQWVIRYNGPGNSFDGANAISIDDFGNVYVTGSSGANADYATIKYSQTVGIETVLSEVPGESRLYQNYPNPFNPSTTISFDIPVWTQHAVSLRVYDLLGREVATLVNEQMQPGSYEVTWDASTSSGQVLASGVYLYQLKAGAFTSTRKMLLVR
jgi:uncharacterized delta-60 repeat protein